MRIFLILMLVLIPVLTGQESAPHTELRVTATLWVGGLATVETDDDDVVSDGRALFLWSAESAADKLLIPYGARSLGVDYRGGRQLFFSERDFNPDVEHDRPPVIAAAEIPPHINECFILFVANGAGDMRYRTFVLDESEAVFPRNAIRLVNLADKTVEFRFRQTHQVLQPGAQTILALDSSQAGSNRLTAAFHAQEGRRLSARDLHVFDGGRITVFLTSNPARPGRVQMRIFADHAPVASPRQ